MIERQSIVDHKPEIYWGIPLDRTNGAKPVFKADQIIFYYTQPSITQDGPVPASTLLLDRERMKEDQSTLSIEGRRKRIAALNRGREIVTSKYQEVFGAATPFNPTYIENIRVITDLIHNLSTNQFHAKKEARNARFNSVTETHHKLRLVKACS